MTREEMRELMDFSAEVQRSFRTSRHNAALSAANSLRDRYAPPSIGERMEYRLQCREDERLHPEWYPAAGGEK